MKRLILILVVGAISLPGCGSAARVHTLESWECHRLHNRPDGSEVVQCASEGKNLAMEKEEVKKWVEYGERSSSQVEHNE